MKNNMGCSSCPPGTFAPGTGMSGCLPCADGEYTEVCCECGCCVVMVVGACDLIEVVFFEI